MRTFTLFRFVLIAAAILCPFTLPIEACPNCYGSTEPRVLDTYLWTALLLSALPFGIVGVIFYAIRKQVSRNQ